MSAHDPSTESTPEKVDSATGVDDEFVRYYAEQSLTPRTEKRFQEICNKVLRAHRESESRPLDVLDVGCGPGELSFLFSERGHRVTGFDINGALIEIGKNRAAERGLDVEFTVASADSLPFEDESRDICVAPELLEHVPDWEACIDELTRILRPGGVLFVSTTNVLCPVQEEFTLPLYSWYPGFVKKRCVELARTSHPEWVSHAEYPAFHWFSYYRLRREFARRGFWCLDRFDTFAPDGGLIKAAIRRAVRVVPGVRLFGQILTPYTQVVAIRNEK